jgi:hypothetical protein
MSLHVESNLMCANILLVSLLVLLFSSLHDDLATVLLIVEQNRIPEKRNKLGS